MSGGGVHGSTRLSSAARRKKPVDPLQKVIPKNPKYEHIEPVLDTGPTVKRYLAKLQAGFYTKRKDEFFGRIKPKVFANMIFQAMQNNEQTETSQTPLTTSQQTSIPPTLPSFHQTFSKGMTGTSLDPFIDLPPIQPPEPQTAYLLLDVRDPELFQQCHIHTAINYPAPLLSRAIDYFVPEIMEYRNKSGHIIVVYDETERGAVRAATLMVQKYIENTYILNDGLRGILEKYPELVVGTLPPSTSSGPSSTRPSRPSSSVSKKTISDVSSESSWDSKSSDTRTAITSLSAPFAKKPPVSRPGIWRV
eukprot:TRINITY_DN7147_c1_g1_i1.p1 TRINITY_DN7147_c1_g1~~TRINITY_DN7147_c1_g1_i1.p1  ORF type:complete len:306 (-),score=63.59 TRINITY_DN7147_c1_g1_i1:70-987(-)